MEEGSPRVENFTNEEIKEILEFRPNITVWKLRKKSFWNTLMYDLEINYKIKLIVL